MDDYLLKAIGHVESPLESRIEAPKQGNEGSPRSWLVMDAKFLPGLQDIAVGDELLVLTWLDRADRNVLRTHPRDDRRNPLIGVFSTRSPDRPNPVGIHQVKVLSIVHGLRCEVENLEALNLTPIVDIKPVLKGNA